MTWVIQCSHTIMKHNATAFWHHVTTLYIIFILEIKILNNWKIQQCQSSMPALQQYYEITVLIVLSPIMCHLFPKTIFASQCKVGRQIQSAVQICPWCCRTKTITLVVHLFVECLNNFLFTFINLAGTAII